LAALAYAFVVSIFVLYEARRRPPDEYLRFHARQGFVLFFVLMVTWNLVLGLLAIGISAMGFMYALSGELWRMPVLGKFANRVPL
jgi:uncharacterized membrane protein